MSGERLRRMTIDRALEITCALKHHKDMRLDGRVWAAYYNLLEDALMQVKMDSSSTVGEHCVDLIDYALEDDITFFDKVIPYCRRHIRSINDNGLLYCVTKIRQQPESRREELEQYGWLDFLDFLESEQLVRNHGE